MFLVFIYATLAQAAALAANRITIQPAPGEVWKLLRMRAIPNVTSTAHASNYFSYRAYKGDGTGTPIAAARDTSTGTGSTLTRGTAIEYGPTGDSPTPTLAFSATGEDLEFTDADPLTIQGAQAASGVLADLSFMFVFERRRPVS